MGDAVVESIRAQLGRGELLTAADIGATAIGDDPVAADPELIWITGLALARCGATERAEALLAAADVEARIAEAAPQLREDIAALGARLIKDRALATDPPDRDRSRRAADAYAEVTAAFDSPYTAVNAATMYLLAGDTEDANARAREALDLLDAASGDPDYWAVVSRAEALLVLGDTAGASQSLVAAAALGPDWAMRSTTVRQLRVVCGAVGCDPAILDGLPLPSVAHYTGHMFAAGPEADLTAAIVEVLDDWNVGAVYGSLACGSDLLVAEAALGRGIELHVVLPCPRDEFVARSVRPGGEQWVERWEQAIDQAATVVAEPTLALGDEAMFAYCDQLAMGFARARAQQLGSAAFQLALWDGVASLGEAGTGAAVARWDATGGETVRIPVLRQDLEPVESSEPVGPTDSARARGVKAMLFADVKGFSALTETDLPDFFERVMAALADVVHGFGDALLYENTWGDALYLVFDGATTAAHCALDLQAEIGRLRSGLGWESLSVRIGGHAGPVFDGYDHVCRERTFYGTHVTRTARIEPRTPPGEVYVTDNFAALVALDAGSALRPEYVGHVPTAKDYGAFPMYVLRR